MSIAEQSFACNALLGKEPENVSFLLMLQFMHVFELPQIDRTSGTGYRSDKILF